MSTLKQFSFTLGITSLFGLGNLVITNPSQAFTLTAAFGDVVQTGDTIYLSTNIRDTNPDSALDNLVGNAYNLSGSSAIDISNRDEPTLETIALEAALGINIGQLDPDPNFVQATEISAAILNLSVPENTTVTLKATFLTNEFFTLNNASDDYAFIVNDGVVRRITSVKNLRNPLIPSIFTDSVIQRPFIAQSREFIFGKYRTGLFPISLGIVGVDDLTETSAAIFTVESALTPVKTAEPSTTIGWKQALVLVFLGFLSLKFSKKQNSNKSTP